MTTLLELLAAIFLWRWADAQDAKAEAQDWETLEAVLGAEYAAARWNLFVSEHSQVGGERTIQP